MAAPDRIDRRGLVWGAVGVAIVVALTFIGSDRLVWFDAALVGYLFGVIFAVFGIVYRYAVWLRRPPTAMLNRRGWDAFRQTQGRATLAALPALVGTQLLAQSFIRRRSQSRWLAHQLVFWGCILAGARDDPAHARPAALRERRASRPTATRCTRRASARVKFDAESIVGWFIFHALDVAAVLVLAGVFIFLRRRLRDPGALATERSRATSSRSPGCSPCRSPACSSPCRASWLDGPFYAALNTLHALTVILGLMYIPFGKLFHIFQRPGNLGVAYYKRANAEGPPRSAGRCGEAFASAQQIADLEDRAARRSGFDYSIDGGGNYQDTCPRCRRASVTLAQSARVGGFG